MRGLQFLAIKALLAMTFDVGHEVRPIVTGSNFAEHLVSLQVAAMRIVVKCSKNLLFHLMEDDDLKNSLAGAIANTNEYLVFELEYVKARQEPALTW